MARHSGTRPSHVLTAVCVALNASHDRAMQLAWNSEAAELLGDAISDVLKRTRGPIEAGLVLMADDAVLTPDEVRTSVEQFFGVRSPDGSRRRSSDPISSGWVARLVDAVVFMALIHGERSPRRGQEP